MSLRITLRKPDTPKGAIALSDLDGLAGAVQTAIYRIVERDLGYSSTGDPAEEIVTLGTLLLTDIDAGSTVLECRGLQIEHLGRHPAMVAASELVDGLEDFRKNGLWPAFLPSSVRSVFSKRLHRTFDDESEITLAVQDNGRVHSCTIASPLVKKLNVPEPHHITGILYAADWRNNTITVDAKSKWVIECDNEWMERATELRKQRVTVEASVDDISKSRARHLQNIRRAHLHEPDGVFSVEESFAETHRLAVESSSAFKSVNSTLDDLAELKENWNSYGAPPINNSIVDFARDFTRAFAGLLLSRNVTPSIPFAGPTSSGGLQFEWDRGDKSLEIEIARVGSFSAFFEDRGKSQEKECNRWETLRLILWVETGQTA